MKGNSSLTKTSTRTNSVRLFGLALLLSFLGSLPPGTTNLMTVKLVADEGLSVAVLFSIGCLLAELVAVSASIFLVDRMVRFKRVTQLLQWISLAILLVLAMVSFVAANRGELPQTRIAWKGSSPFIAGFFVMMVNPVQLPFWLGWTTVLVEKRLLRAGGIPAVLYVLGSGLGAIIASFCFIWLGQTLTEHLTIAPSIFHLLLGTLFFIAFLSQLWKIVQRRRATG